MFEGIVSTAKAEAAHTATRGALYAYAGLMAAIASGFVATAIVLSLIPVIGPGLAWLCGGLFLLFLGLAVFFIAQAKGRPGAAAAQARQQAAAAAAAAGSGNASAGGINYAALLANGLAAGMLEKELEQHPVRMMAAALAAGTVMGIMEAQESGK